MERPMKVAIDACARQNCKYLHRYCNQRRLEDYDYCIRHILEDKSAPFQQCAYVHRPSKKRCMNAAPKLKASERKEYVYCPFHVKQLHRSKTKDPPKKAKRATKDAASLLRSLEHHCVKPNHSRSYTKQVWLTEQYDHGPCGGASTSVADLEPTDNPSLGEKTFVDRGEEMHKMEMVGDPLKHAGVYTPKEIALISKDKMLRLQKLYIQELYMLKASAKENYRKFRRDDQKAQQGHPFPAELSKPLSADEEQLLLNLMKYHRYSPLEKLFRHRSYEKRAGVTSPAKQQCDFEGCSEVALPLTKFCTSHILSDQKQVLFRPCTPETCTTPIVPYGDHTSCALHLVLKSKMYFGDERPPDGSLVDDQQLSEIVRKAVLDLKKESAPDPNLEQSTDIPAPTTELTVQETTVIVSDAEEKDFIDTSHLPSEAVNDPQPSTSGQAISEEDLQTIEDIASLDFESATSLFKFDTFEEEDDSGETTETGSVHSQGDLYVGREDSVDNDFGFFR